MASPFVAEIRAFGFNFAPYQWAFCDGQLMGISQNTALFSLLGTTYGGNGQSTFGLPNLQSRAPMQWGDGAGLSSYALGEMTGSSAVTLISSEMPSHNHLVQAAEAAGHTTEATGSPDSTTWLGFSNPAKAYISAAPNTQMSPKAIGPNGGSQAHNNMQPYLTMNFCISLYGVYPARN